MNEHEAINVLAEYLKDQGFDIEISKTSKSLQIMVNQTSYIDIHYQSRFKTYKTHYFNQMLEGIDVSIENPYCFQKIREWVKSIINRQPYPKSQEQPSSASLQ